MTSNHRYTALFAAAAATVLIAACGEKVDNTTVGQQVDNATATVQSAATEMKNDAQVAASDMQAAGSKAADSATQSATDMAITTKVNAALAADDQLSALKIDVDTEAGNVALTQRLLQASRAAGLRRFVHLSAASVVMQHPAPLIDIDESQGTTCHPDLPYSSTKAAAEALVLSAAGHGLQTVALRPPLVWGPGDTVDGELGRHIASGRFGWFSGGRFPYATCHVDNLCEAVSLALHASSSGLACFVTDGEPVALRSFLIHRIAARGLVAPRLSVPTMVAWHAAGGLHWLWRSLHMASPPPLTREAVRLLGCPFTLRIDRARQALAYRPVLSVEEGLQRLRAHHAASQRVNAAPDPSIEAP